MAVGEVPCHMYISEKKHISNKEMLIKKRNKYQKERCLSKRERYTEKREMSRMCG